LKCFHACSKSWDGLSTKEVNITNESLSRR
jgi:hypothetical protein